MGTLSRVTTWTTNQVLTSSALNSEFNNILNAWNNIDAGTADWSNLSVSGELDVTGASASKFIVTSAGLVGVNSPSILATSGGVDISSGGLGLIGGADGAAITRTDNTLKTFRIGMAHYDNEATPICMAQGTNNGTANTMNIGGGTSTMNTCTNVNFYTAANVTTTTGTQTGGISLAGCWFKGTNTNDNAAAGVIGEVVEAANTTGTAIATTGFANVATISLTAGDWDVTGLAVVTGAVNFISFSLAVSAYSGNTTTDHVDGSNVLFYSMASNVAQSGTIPSLRVSLAGSATYYLKVKTYGASSTMTGCRITARRRR